MRRLYSDVLVHAPTQTVKPGGILEAVVTMLHNAPVLPHRQVSHAKAILHVISRADFTSWWSVQIGATLRAVLHTLLRVPEVEDYSIATFLRGFSSSGCKVISEYLQGQYESANAALEGSRANLLIRPTDTNRNPTAWHNILRLRHKESSNGAIGEVAADISAHLCQLHRSGADISSLLDEFTDAEDSGFSARNLFNDRYYWPATDFAIHMKEISPAWWQTTKAALQSAPESPELATETSRFIVQVDTAGPCDQCPARLEFKRAINTTEEQVPEGEDGLEAETRSGSAVGPARSLAPAPITKRLRSTAVSAAFHRLFGRPNAGRDIEAEPSG
jgi:hypothetical protein